jgi:adenylate cyclase
MGERDLLLRRLRDAGLDEEHIATAQTDGRLTTLAVEMALGGPERYTLSEVARAVRLPVKFARQALQAAGRPTPGRGKRTLTEDDLRFARVISELLDAGMPREELLQVARIVSQSTAQSADAVRRMVAGVIDSPGDSEYAVGLRYAELTDDLGQLFPRMLLYHFRAHLRDGLRTQLLTQAEFSLGELSGSTQIAVAFADLVGYTRLGEQLTSDELGEIAQRLAALAADVAHGPVRLVKTIGDAALFASPEVPALLEALTRLVAAVEAEGRAFPRVRAGVAYGAASHRGGDWFGAPVNLASRITEVTRPGHIFADEAVRDRADGFAWKRGRRRRLKGIALPVRLFALGSA